MTEENKIRESYLLAERILKPFIKSTLEKGIDDPLALVCLAQLLYSYKHEKVKSYLENK